MCGITGYKTNSDVDEHVLKSMLQALYHRGPDSEGIYKNGEYCAGVRRLSVNDLETGDQPLFNRDKSVVLLYNGEIYNSPKLRRELKNKGYRFSTRSDGEVICYLYEEYGDDLFEYLDGMFAVALWVEREKKLILARDIPGEKPLYYAQLSKKELVFASELKSLTLFPNLDLTLNYQGLWDFLTFLWIPQPATAYKSVMALPKSHLLIADNNGIRVRPYNNKFNKREFDLSDVTVIEETKRVVKEAVESRLLSDVPVGSFLSSGLDSSVIAALASKALPNLSTYTIAFEDVHDPYHGKADESAYAEKYAKMLCAKHRTIRVTSNDFRKDILNFSKNADQPFSVSSALGILAVARAAHEDGVKVLLSGDGADECFGGYSWYSFLHYDGIIQKEDYVKDSMSFQNFGLDLQTRLSRLFAYSPQKRAWAWHYYASEVEKTNLYNPAMFRDVKSSLRFFYDFNKYNIWRPEDFIKQDRDFYLTNEMLQKVDLMTMAYSVEGRCPFTAPAVLSHADKLKSSHMLKGNTLKWALREAFSDLLPEEVSRRPKHGFNVPIDHWLKNDWADLFDETFCGDSSLVKMGIIHKKSREVAYSMLHDKYRLNGHTIFSLIMLNIWLENNRHGNYC